MSERSKGKIKEGTWLNSLNYASKDDEELVKLSQTDAKALEYLLEKYKNLVRARARGYFLAGADREDIIQEGMIGLYKAIRDYRPEHSSFCAFADLCITRQVLSAVKTATRQKHIPLNSYVSFNKPVFSQDGERTIIDLIATDVITDPEEIILGKEKFSAVKNTLYDKLSSLELEVLKLYLEGLSYSEIAQIIKKPEKSVDNALQRIKSKMAEVTCMLDKKEL